MTKGALGTTTVNIFKPVPH